MQPGPGRASGAGEVEPGRAFHALGTGQPWSGPVSRGAPPQAELSLPTRGRLPGKGFVASNNLYIGRGDDLRGLP
eukprot:14255492-Heterocapsa_arctica.AAC.1